MNTYTNRGLEDTRDDLVYESEQQMHIYKYLN